MATNELEREYPYAVTTPRESTLRPLLITAVALLAAIAALLAIDVFSHPPDRWSYVVLAPKDEDLIKQLDQAGSLGWEVVSARRATSGEDQSSKASYELILKRRGSTAIPESTSK